MSEEWISPKAILGSVATGDYYFPRTEIVDQIWIEIKRNNHTLIAAPRRVGKTSIMRDLEENPHTGYLVKFKIIQAISSEIDFYQTIYELILTCLNKSTRVKKWIQSYLKSKSISEIDLSQGKITFKDKTIDYCKEINEIFKNLDSNAETVVLLLDELPEVLHNINKAGKIEEAKAILKQLRTWRQSEFKKLQFVLAGSIGIHYVVKTIEGRTADLNDLKKVICEPLSENQAFQYIDWATASATVKYNDKLQAYLIEKIQNYYTPYYLNLMLCEIDEFARSLKNYQIETRDIDNAFIKVLKNNDHFADWKNRLSDYLPTDDFHYVNEILTHIAHKHFITIQTIYDKAVVHKKTLEYMELIHNLEQDGYITEDGDTKSYIFISPFLKQFWLTNNPIYNA